MNRGIFISVEGTDGSGKTTQVQLMKNYLIEKGYQVILLREPGGTSIGEKIRAIILDPENKEMSIITEMLLYAAARAQLVSEVIRPAIDEGKVIICDRFLDSSFVYQGFGRGIKLEAIQQVNSIALNGIMPDITLFFDIDPQVALNRRIASSEADRIEQENIDFHTNVYLGYKKLVDMFPDRIKSINSNRDIDDIFNDVKALLDSHFK